MSASHAIPELDRKGLREFGLVTGGIVAVLFGLGFPWLLGRGLPLWPWVIFAVLGGLGLLAPMSLRPIYRGWMRFGLFMSKIMTPLVMGIVFYLVVTPFGLVRRLLAEDPMARRLAREQESYRVPSETLPKDRLEKPF